MAKKSYVIMRLVNEEVKTHTQYIMQIPARGTKQGMKPRLRKYDPVTRKHHWFKTVKMPAHAK